jgi:hypothetical protein
MRTKRIGMAGGLVGLALAGTVALAPSASATDYGGDGNPATDCPNAYTAASAPITDSAGTTIGLVELRWSYSCSGNWTRTTSYNGTRSLVSVVGNSDDTVEASADDVASQNFTPYLRVPASQRMCAAGYINAGNNQWYGNAVCSN